LDETAPWVRRYNLSMRIMTFALLVACSAPALWSQFGRMNPRFRMPPEIFAPELADPARFHVEVENDRVRVLRLALHGEEDVPLLGDRAGLLVCVDECHVRVTRPHGRSEDIHLRAGE